MDDKPTTPLIHAGFSSTAELSPPSSQGNPPMNSPSIANANGKRPLSTLDSNGDSRPMTRASNAPSAVEPAEVKTHEASGYSWAKPEDAPGWAWNNKRALEEGTRAWESLLFKDKKVANRYGDPFEMADSEAAVLASQSHR